MIHLPAHITAFAVGRLEDGFSIRIGTIEIGIFAPYSLREFPYCFGFRGQGHVVAEVQDNAILATVPRGFCNS